MKSSILCFLLGFFVSTTIFYFVTRKSYSDSVTILDNQEFFYLKKNIDISDTNSNYMGGLKKGMIIKKLITFSEGYSTYVMFFNIGESQKKDIIADTSFKDKILCYPYSYIKEY